MELLPLTYLGLPLGATFKAAAIWIGVLEKLKNYRGIFYGGELGDEFKYHLISGRLFVYRFNIGVWECII